MTSRMRLDARVSIAWLLVALAGCAAAPAVAPMPATPPFDAPAAVAAIRAAAGPQDGELTVQPLRDPAIEDLRQSAARLESAGQYPQAAATLDRALALVPDDPALLQERAEAALLLGDPAAAEALARRAEAIGPKVGPLCRRNWATVRTTRMLAGDAAGVQAAAVQLAACKVSGPVRY